MKKRFRVLPTGAGLEASLNSLYMDGYVLHTATDTAVIMECFAVTDTDMRRQRADASHTWSSANGRPAIQLERE